MVFPRSHDVSLSEWPTSTVFLLSVLCVVSATTFAVGCFVKRPGCSHLCQQFPLHRSLPLAGLSSAANLGIHKLMDQMIRCQQLSTFVNFLVKAPWIYGFYASFYEEACLPELPDWFKFAEGEQSCDLDSGDDFVLPTRLESLEDIANYRKPHERKTFLQIVPSGDPCNGDTDEISNVLNARFRSPEEASLALCNCSMKISKDLIDQILTRFSNDWIPSLGFFRWVEFHVGCKNSPETYDMMVDILGKSKQFDIMWQLIEEMAHLSGLISLSTMTKVIRRLAGAARWKEAIAAFHEMENFGIKKNTESMNVLLDSLCKEKSTMRATVAFLNLRKEIPPNASSFNILIHGLCKAGKLEEAWQTMEEMKEYGFKPCVITYTSLIEAHCFGRDFQMVESILREMQTEKCVPNVITYTIIMHSLGKANETQAAFWVLERMKRDGCMPDASFYNSLIYILGREGRLREAYNVYEDMCKAGIFPNAATFNTLISACCSHSQEKNALKLLVEMEEKSSCKPEIKTYAPLLKLSCRRKWMRVLLFLLGHMFRRDISIDLGTYTLLVHGFCRNGKVKHACIYYEEMIWKGFVPKQHTNYLLLEALERKNMDAAKLRIQKLISKIPDMQQRSFRIHMLEAEGRST
ncbi:Pentatricopeptide repeat-containing protein [Apostasia shenzhenica]|uniref:Pentatricopeptide repeat-containing protein n=1 Tax=Apostasia shenzhenica TaxID=1088818 RepID=A0A2I0ART8_9ASPA|nr:Pentatricopeptide repeat-containing protein [Apostasia shenzhenica]